MTVSPTAALRDAGRSSTVRVTVWYPAPDGVPETRRAIGPPGEPFFLGGSASDEAPLAPVPERWPVLLLAHGFGGSARIMSWFGTALARSGKIVVAVDHPGNTMAQPLTVQGAVLWWERAEDLRYAWDTVRTDPGLGSRVDPARLGVAGFSLGGLTALVAAGARIDLARLDRFCSEHEDDGVCRPQLEIPGVSGRTRAAAFDSDAMSDLELRASNAHVIPGLRGAFVMAPAIVQALDPASLAALTIPTRLVFGSSDDVAPPATNGQAAASLIPDARVSVVSGAGHYDFLSECTDGGRRSLSVCRGVNPQAELHRAVIDQAIAFFAATLSGDR